MSYGSTDRPLVKNPIQCLVVVAVIALAVHVAGMVGCPQYNVYVKTKEGEVELKQAEQNRQIIVQSAQAKKEAAKYERDAEILRAEGVAGALAKVKEELQNLTHEQALVLILYKWVQGLNDESSQVIYVPTESNLPVLLEAGSIANSKGPKNKGLAIEKELRRDVTREDYESGVQVRE